MKNLLANDPHFIIILYMRERSLKIYVCCHKDYKDAGINNSCYKLITNKDIKNYSKLELFKVKTELDDRMWSELAVLHYIWKHAEFQADFIGLNHYRRYFDFKNDIPTKLDKPIVAKRETNIFNNYMCYDIYHNSTNLLNIAQIVSDKFNEYSSFMTLMLDSHVLNPCNMFIFSKELFNEYCNFIFGVLLEYDNMLHINNNYYRMLQHIENNSSHYTAKAFHPNNTTEYQARMYGFLAERLTTAFLIKYTAEHDTHSIIEYPIYIPT